MGLIEAILAIVGLGLLILLTFGTLSDEAPAPAPEDDLAAPYREGLHAALRLQGAAQELRQELYVEAARRALDEREGEGRNA
jgi:hypothetical protein